MSSNLKAVLIIVAGVLGIFGGEVLKQSLTSWREITTLPFMAGIAVQTGAFIMALVGAVNYTRRNGADAVSEAARTRLP